MKYDLTPNEPRPLDRVVAGCASDARWRAVEMDSDKGVTVLSTAAHRAERAAARAASEARRDDRAR